METCKKLLIFKYEKDEQIYNKPCISEFCTLNAGVPAGCISRAYFRHLMCGVPEQITVKENSSSNSPSKFSKVFPCLHYTRVISFLNMPLLATFIRAIELVDIEPEYVH